MPQVDKPSQRNRSANNRIIIASLLILLSSCSSLSGDARLTPAQLELRDANRRFATTVGQGAALGAIGGGLIGALVGGKKGVLIGAAAGGIVGSASGYAVAHNNLRQSHTETNLQNAIDEASADAEAYERSADASAKIASDLGARRRQLDQQYAANAVSTSQYRAEIATYASSAEIVRGQISDMQTQIDRLHSDGHAYGSVELDRLAQRIESARRREVASLHLIDATLSDCDPSRAGLLSGIGCVVSGGYTAREAELRNLSARADAEKQVQQAAAMDAQKAADVQAPSASGGEKLSPLFPWPPPTASAWAVIGNDYITGGKARTVTLSTAAERLGTVLDAAGYSQRSFYSVPGGFAIVTEMERINDDASPAYEDRWRPMGQDRDFSLRTYLYGLLYADPGRFRLIVLVVSNQSFSLSSQPITPSIAQRWTSHGINMLPSEIGDQAYDARHYSCMALIYEFKLSRQNSMLTPMFVAHSVNPGRVHLEKASIWPALEKSERR